MGISRLAGSRYKTRHGQPSGWKPVQNKTYMGSRLAGSRYKTRHGQSSGWKPVQNKTYMGNRLAGSRYKTRHGQPSGWKPVQNKTWVAVWLETGTKQIRHGQPFAQRWQSTSNRKEKAIGPPPKVGIYSCPSKTIRTCIGRSTRGIYCSDSVLSDVIR